MWEMCFGTLLKLSKRWGNNLSHAHEHQTCFFLIGLPNTIIMGFKTTFIFVGNTPYGVLKVSTVFQNCEICHFDDFQETHKSKIVK